MSDKELLKVLTISVAAYNIEEYIHKMMHSIIASNRMDCIEVLIIDDGSGDDTAKIASDYEEKYPESVRLICKDNGGHGSTINRGIKEARGKYFRALDGDDWVNSDNLCELVDELESIDTDIVICDFDRCYSDGRVTTEAFENIEALRVYSFAEAANKVGWMCYHTLIYSTRILQEHGIRLDEHCFYVDTEYDLFPIPYINSLLYFGKPVYCYRLGVDGQSVSIESRKKYINHSLTVVRSLLSMCVEKSDVMSEAQRKYVIYGIADLCIWHIRSLLMFGYSLSKQNEIKDFDQMIKKTSNEVFVQMEMQGTESRIIRSLRKTGYFSYWIIKLYKSINMTY